MSHVWMAITQMWKCVEKFSALGLKLSTASGTWTKQEVAANFASFFLLWKVFFVSKKYKSSKFCLNFQSRKQEEEQCLRFIR